MTPNSNTDNTNEKYEYPYIMWENEGIRVVKGIDQYYPEKLYAIDAMGQPAWLSTQWSGPWIKRFVNYLLGHQEFSASPKSRTLVDEVVGELLGRSNEKE